MTHLTTAETQYDLDLVAVAEKTQSMLDLGVEVVLLYAARKLNFLEFDRCLLLFGSFFLLFAFKAELAVVHYTAYRRL